MIKNKELLELIAEQKNRIDCKNCKHCNQGAFNSGKWYCKNPKVSVFDDQLDIEKCFER